MLRRSICYLVIFFFFCSLEASEIENKLKKIPTKDREKIEELFSYFVQRENLGFVLFKETKPACMISLPLTHRKCVLPHKIDDPMRFQRNLEQCWCAWSYYAHLFKHPGIVVCKEYERINGGMYLQLFIVNKKTAKLVLEKNRADFAAALGNDFSPQKFIEKLEKRKRLRPLIHNDHKLLGLLLGFGPESSQAFKDMVLGIKLDPPLARVSCRPKGCCITPVSFRGYPDSSEVKPLIETYTREILEIENIFNSDSFLTTTLEKFCAP